MLFNMGAALNASGRRMDMVIWCEEIGICIVR